MKSETKNKIKVKVIYIVIVIDYKEENNLLRRGLETKKQLT